MINFARLLPPIRIDLDHSAVVSHKAKADCFIVVDRCKIDRCFHVVACLPAAAADGEDEVDQRTGGEVSHCKLSIKYVGRKRFHL